MSPAAPRSSLTGWPGLAHLTTLSIMESRVHNERCTPGSGRGRSESYRRELARRRAPTSPKSTALACKRHNSAVPAVLASDAKKAMRQDATTKVSLEFVKHEGRQLAAAFFQFRQKRRPVLLYGSVQQGRFGTMAFVRHRACGRVGGTACCWLLGKHQQEFSATRRYLLLTKCGIWHSRQSRACGVSRSCSNLGDPGSCKQDHGDARQFEQSCRSWA